MNIVRLTLISAVFSITLSSLSPAYAANIVANGDFETGNLSGWILNSSDFELNQGAVAASGEFVPPLSGFVYKIRPGSQSPDAGIQQSLPTQGGVTYSYNFVIAAREAQETPVPFALGEFQFLVDGAVKESTILANNNLYQEVFEGTFLSGSTGTDIEFRFNRSLNSFTAHPQWFVDNVSVQAVPEPLTILGSATACLFGGLLKREYSRKQKKS